MIVTLGWVMHWLALGYGFGRWAAVKWAGVLLFSIVIIADGGNSVGEAVRNIASQRVGEPHILITIGLFIGAYDWGKIHARGDTVGDMWKRLVRDLRVWWRLREAKRLNREQGY